MIDKPYIVTATPQLLALASPGREDIIDAVGALGPCGVTEIARFLGRSRNALYYHVRALRDVGVLIETEVQGTGGRRTAHYDLPGWPVIVRFDLSTPRTRRAVATLGRFRFRTGERGFVRACDPAVAVVEGMQRNLWVSHLKGWLSVSELERANQLFHELVNLFRHPADQGSGERKPYELTFAIAPMRAVRPKSKKKKKKKG
jgi:DNA-binding transcriptional ArsR family regulator